MQKFGWEFRWGLPGGLRTNKATDAETKTLTVRARRAEARREQLQNVRAATGTYIRTFAEDIGKKLGTGAYLTALRRTKIGTYDIKNAKQI